MAVTLVWDGHPAYADTAITDLLGYRNDYVRARATAAIALANKGAIADDVWQRLCTDPAPRVRAWAFASGAIGDGQVARLITLLRSDPTVIHDDWTQLVEWLRGSSRSRLANALAERAESAGDDRPRLLAMAGVFDELYGRRLLTEAARTPNQFAAMQLAKLAGALPGEDLAGPHSKQMIALMKHRDIARRRVAMQLAVTVATRFPESVLADAVRQLAIDLVKDGMQSLGFIASDTGAGTTMPAGAEWQVLQFATTTVPDEIAPLLAEKAIELVGAVDQPTTQEHLGAVALALTSCHRELDNRSREKLRKALESLPMERRTRRVASLVTLLAD